MDIETTKEQKIQQQIINIWKEHKRQSQRLSAFTRLCRKNMKEMEQCLVGLLLENTNVIKANNEQINIAQILCYALEQSQQLYIGQQLDKLTFSDKNIEIFKVACRNQITGLKLVQFSINKFRQLSATQKQNSLQLLLLDFVIDLMQKFPCIQYSPIVSLIYYLQKLMMDKQNAYYLAYYVQFVGILHQNCQLEHSNWANMIYILSPPNLSQVDFYSDCFDIILMNKPYPSLIDIYVHNEQKIPFKIISQNKVLLIKYVKIISYYLDHDINIIEHKFHFLTKENIQENQQLIVQSERLCKYLFETYKINPIIMKSLTNFITNNQRLKINLTVTIYQLLKSTKTSDFQKYLNCLEVYAYHNNGMYQDMAQFRLQLLKDVIKFIPHTITYFTRQISQTKQQILKALYSRNNYEPFVDYLAALQKDISQAQFSEIISKVPEQFFRKPAIIQLIFVNQGCFWVFSNMNQFKYYIKSRAEEIVKIVVQKNNNIRNDSSAQLLIYCFRQTKKTVQLHWLRLLYQLRHFKHLLNIELVNEINLFLNKGLFHPNKQVQQLTIQSYLQYLDCFFSCRTFQLEILLKYMKFCFGQPRGHILIFAAIYQSPNILQMLTIKDQKIITTFIQKLFLQNITFSNNFWHSLCIAGIIIYLGQAYKTLYTQKKYIVAKISQYLGDYSEAKSVKSQLKNICQYKRIFVEQQQLKSYSNIKNQHNTSLKINEYQTFRKYAQKLREIYHEQITIGDFTRVEGCQNIRKIVKVKKLINL